MMTPVLTFKQPTPALLLQKTTINPRELNFTSNGAFLRVKQPAPLLSFKIPSPSLLLRKTKMKMRDLDFSGNGGFPSVKQPTISMDPLAVSAERLRIQIQSSCPFAKKVLLYESPAKQAMDDVLVLPSILQEAVGHIRSSKILSLSANSLENVPHDIDDAVKRISQGEFGMVILEPIQSFLSFRPFHVKAIRMACDVTHTVLIFDETQCGLGRSGGVWAHTSFDVQPDAMLFTFGHKIGVGALLLNEFFADQYHFSKRCNFVSPRCVDAYAVLHMVSNKAYLAEVERKAVYFQDSLNATLSKHTQVADIRSCGMIKVMELKGSAFPVAIACKQQGLLVNMVPQNTNIIRLMPSMEVNKIEIRLAIKIIQKSLKVSY